MDYLKYYEDINVKRQLKSLARQYKNKKIVVYGAGLMSNLLFENYDLSLLNIVAVCDKKFVKSTEEKYYGYQAISPNDLKTYDFDAVLVLILNDTEVVDYLKDELLINTKNENKIVSPFFKIPFFYALKILIS